MEISLEALGLTKEEIQDRVVDGLVHRLVYSRFADEEGHDVEQQSDFRRTLDALVKERISAAVTEIAERELLPRVTQTVESIVLQETTKWGEKKGEPVTFTQYLVQRAEDYIREEVDWNGKSKAEAGSYTWSKGTTRISFLIHQHLQLRIEAAVKEALSVANAAIAGGLQDAVKIKLEEVVKGLKIAVTTK